MYSSVDECEYPCNYHRYDQDWLHFYHLKIIPPAPFPSVFPPLAPSHYRCAAPCHYRLVLLFIQFNINVIIITCSMCIIVRSTVLLKYAILNSIYNHVQHILKGCLALSVIFWDSYVVRYLSVWSFLLLAVFHFVVK